MPGLYADGAKTWTYQLFYQQYLNISTNDPINFLCYLITYKKAFQKINNCKF
jgi:hypothetical protein